MSHWFISVCSDFTLSHNSNYFVPSYLLSSRPWKLLLLLLVDNLMMWLFYFLDAWNVRGQKKSSVTRYVKWLRSCLRIIYRFSFWFWDMFYVPPLAMWSVIWRDNESACELLRGHLGSLVFGSCYANVHVCFFLIKKKLP